MANWKYKIELKDIIEKSDDIPIETLGKEVSERLKSIKIKEESYRTYLLEIADEFEDVSSVDTFDIALNRLYDWGDIETSPSRSVIQNRLCWINTTF